MVEQWLACASLLGSVAISGIRAGGHRKRPYGKRPLKGGTDEWSTVSLGALGTNTRTGLHALAQRRLISVGVRRDPTICGFHREPSFRARAYVRRIRGPCSGCATFEPPIQGHEMHLAQVGASHSHGPVRHGISG